MDTDLVTAAQHGDEEAFASLAIAVGGRLHAVAHRILRDLDLAGRGSRLEVTVGGLPAKQVVITQFE